jgi:1,4-alpha-glucan branching enzyme
VEKGYLSIVLHAHLPFVHHPESEGYIEERWLYEAITETYIPLLDVFDGLVLDQMPFRVTMSLTPTLLSMLANPLLQERYVRYLDNLIVLAKQEVKRVKEHKDFLLVADMYLHRFEHIKLRFEQSFERNIIKGFRELEQSGHLELITSSATHAFLPYVQTEEALRAQIENAILVHTAHLGRAPRGIWLPECGFKEGHDRILKDYGLRFFFTDTHSVLHADPMPAYGVHAPILTPHGVAAFARDPETSRQVWSAKEGYPGDYDYREYYRDIGYDLDYEYIKPYLHQSGVRLNTGIKYYRISGGGDHKEVYNPDWARGKAGDHAGNFIYNREKQIEYLSAQLDRKPLIIASYDAELFGHWWYEGPIWIDRLCRKIHTDQQTFTMITPSEYLLEYPESQECELSFSTWGRGGYGDVWLNDSNQWIYRHLHQMEKRMIELARSYPDATGLKKRALNQAVRELLLAQSSDWAFIMDTGTMVDYAIRRTKNHIGRFNKISEDLREDRLEERWLEEVERRDDIFPDLNYRVFLPPAEAGNAKPSSVRDIRGRNRLKVLMLSWEYPPMMVGGLSRHVYDLSKKLVEQGTEVHVVTCHVDGYPNYELNGGVHVHRVQTYQAKELPFMDWIFQLNLKMADYASGLITHYGPFDLIHAHDWLVNRAAKALKHQFYLPLAATIHATEHGRNQGLFTDLHHSIHHQEWELTYEACRVIGCSKYMEQEIKSLFQLPADKLDIIPNGVDSEMIYHTHIDPSIRQRFAMDHEKIVFFVGRLVREKGVHILLESIPSILRDCPEAKFVIAGKGPMLEELKHRAFEMGVAEKVLFTGFIDDQTRNQLFRLAHAAVFPSIYEPFGIVALEAMSARVPLIVSGVGGLAEIISHGEDGFTVLPGDVPSLSMHIARMLRDEALAKGMADRAWDKVSVVYNWDNIAKQTRDTYYKILKSYASRDSYFEYTQEAAAAKE